jgi:hypothetical protein
LASTRSQVSPDINEKTSVEARATSHPERKWESTDSHRNCHWAAVGITLVFHFLTPALDLWSASAICNWALCCSGLVRRGQAPRLTGKRGPKATNRPFSVPWRMQLARFVFMLLGLWVAPPCVSQCFPVLEWARISFVQGRILILECTHS